MYSVLVTSALALFGLCSARPATPDQSPQYLDNEGPSQGFALEHLPTGNFTGGTRNGLKLPLPPAGYPGFGPIFDFYYDQPTNGLQLIQSIVTGVYQAWRDTENRPLASPQVRRSNPFTQFKFNVWPLVAGRFTPQKLGLTYCWMLFSMLQLDRWPSHTASVIKEQAQQIGAIDITTEPRNEEPVPTSSSVNITGDFSDPDFRRQQRWARCFLTTLQLPIVHFPALPVTSDPYFAPRPGIPKYPFPCRSPGFADRVDLFIYPAANVGSPTQLTWDGMARNLINWMTQVAGDQVRTRSFKMFQSNVLVAEVSMYLQPGDGVDETDTATA